MRCCARWKLRSGSNQIDRNVHEARICANKATWLFPEPLWSLGIRPWNPACLALQLPAAPAGASSSSCSLSMRQSRGRRRPQQTPSTATQSTGSRRATTHKPECPQHLQPRSAGHTIDPCSIVTPNRQISKRSVFSSFYTAQRGRCRKKVMYENRT